MRAILAGSRVDLVTLDEVLSAVALRLRSGEKRPLFLASANMDHVRYFGHGGIHHGLLEKSPSSDWLVLLDGMPLVWTARRLTGQSWQQLAGSDMLPDLIALANEAGARVGFLGGSPELHNRLAIVLSRRWPGIRVAGYWSPERATIDASESARSLAREIAAAKVDILFVALGRPREELWLLEHADEMQVKVGTAFGAAGDFLAGMVLRAPTVLRRLGLEWAYRLAREPRRLWRRYLLNGPSALFKLLTRSGPDPALTDADS